MICQPPVFQVAGALRHQDVVFGFTHQSERSWCRCAEEVTLFYQEDLQQIVLCFGVKQIRLVAK